MRQSIRASGETQGNQMIAKINVSPHPGQDNSANNVRTSARSTNKLSTTVENCFFSLSDKTPSYEGSCQACLAVDMAYMYSLLTIILPGSNRHRVYPYL